MLQQGWHLHLAQSSTSVRLFLEAAGSRATWLAEQMQQQEQQPEELEGIGEEEEDLQQQQQQGEEQGRMSLGLQGTQAGARSHQVAATRGQQQGWAADGRLEGRSQQQQRLFSQSAVLQGEASGRQQHSSRGRAGSPLPAAAADAGGVGGRRCRSLLKGDASSSEDVDSDGDGEQWMQQRQQMGRKSTGSDFMSWLEEQQPQPQQQQQPHRNQEQRQQPQQRQQQPTGSQQQPQQGSPPYPGVRGQPQRVSAAAGVGRGAGSSRGGYGLDGVIPDSEEEDDVIVLD